MMRRRRIGHAGTSIVEILVAMVILVIGIFGIIRVFPTGFGMILYGEKVSRATTLANARLEYARSNAENLPDAVVPVTLNAQNMAVVDARLTPATEAHDLTGAMPADPVQASFFGFNRTRRVIGETTKIPPPTANVPYVPNDTLTNRPQLISLYTLQFGPLDLGPGPQARAPMFLVYSGRPLERVVYTSELTPADAQELGLLRYGVVYGRDRLILFFEPVDYPRVFKVQYSYVISDPTGPFRAQSLPGTAVPLARGAHRVEVPMPGGAVPEQSEEQVSRAFTELPLGAQFSTRDPYQYKVLNPFVGILGFNPLGSLLRRGRDSAALSAKIDYDVADWHIVSEEIEAPQEPPFRVKLTLNFLKRTGDVQDNQTEYLGLTPQLAQQRVDFVIVDLERGLTMDSRTLLPENATDNGAINYQTGVLDLSPGVRWSLPSGTMGPVESIAGKHLRVYYRTEDEFGLQVQKAFTNYLRSQSPLALTPGQYGQMPNGYLVFPASDHRQSVLVDYSFTQEVPGAVPPMQRRVRVSGELQPIRDPLTDPTAPQNLFAPLRTDPANTFWFLRLNNRDRTAVDPPDDPNRPRVVPGSITVHSVRGVSVRSRVVWREGNRWRRLENSTYLSRQGT